MFIACASLYAQIYLSFSSVDDGLDIFQNITKIIYILLQLKKFNLPKQITQVLLSLFFIIYNLLSPD